ncbi:MAG TPA: RodZ domain-containing protein [Steroidobacteraceae bacterium]|nr:RodZ domain-containing protein [Steroidobacteraceae bacterium]
MNEPVGAAAGAAGAEPGTPGGMLRAERERRGYSVQQVAEELHLDVWLIEALEENRFAALGAPVYAKGHLRKYATLLGFSTADVLERYEALSGTPAVPTPIPAAMVTPLPRERRRVPKAPLWIAFALAVAGGLAWLIYELWPLTHGAGIATTSEAPAAVAPLSAPVQVAQAPAPVARPPVVEPAAATTPAAGEVRLRLEFSEQSWTEIYDSGGRRLMFDMGTAGQVRTVSGMAPLRVNLGQASAVAARVDDRPIVIPRRAGRDGARFLIEADGSVKPESSLKTAEREAIE